MDFKSVKKELTVRALGWHQDAGRVSILLALKVIFSIFYEALIFLWFVSFHQRKRNEQPARHEVSE